MCEKFQRLFLRSSKRFVRSSKSTSPPVEDETEESGKPVVGTGGRSSPSLGAIGVAMDMIIRCVNTSYALYIVDM